MHTRGDDTPTLASLHGGALSPYLPDQEKGSVSERISLKRALRAWTHRAVPSLPGKLRNTFGTEQ